MLTTGTPLGAVEALVLPLTGTTVGGGLCAQASPPRTRAAHKAATDTDTDTAAPRPRAVSGATMQAPRAALQISRKARFMLACRFMMICAQMERVMRSQVWPPSCGRKSGWEIGRA